MFLYEELETYEKYSGLVELPKYIEKNLASNINLRPYQIKTFQNFITYFENDKFKKNNNNIPIELLFHMATGSGKTVIMAGLIIYLYSQGYRNFLFFVNSDNIIQKTKENFLNSASLKYLFNEKLNINGKYIRINEVTNFENFDNDNINICFSTIQGLHTKLTKVCENSLSFDDFLEKKIVLIADEAHHLNANTKRTKKEEKAEKELENTWETTVKHIFESNKDNIMLEFTATCDLQNKDIKNKYENKIIMNYPLVNFRNDRYSKEVETLSVGMEIDDRVIQAVLLNQYRLKLFQKNKIAIKPVIMFKHKGISLSTAYKQHFHNLIKNLTIEQILNIKNTSTASIVQKMFKYFEENTTLENLIEEIKEGFSEENCISVNDEKQANNYQIKVNTLEDRNNLIRCVFAVDKLNEGWDVLNLFDIVRLYESQSKRSDGVPEKQTVQEAQLIGRGARYCPFVINDYDNKHQRKFDNDIDNELRVCETLYYHCKHDNSYIGELRRAMRDIGIKDDNSIEVNYQLKDSFKQTKLYNDGFLFENSKKLKFSENFTNDFPKLKKDIFYINVPSGESMTARLLDDETVYEENTLVPKYTTLKQLKEINYRILNKAIRQFPIMQFSNLKQKYKNLKTTREFLTDSNYLGNIQLSITSGTKTLTQEQYYYACKEILNKISDAIMKKEDEFVGTKEFKAKKLKEIIKDKKIKLSTIEKDSVGVSQNDCIDEDLRLNLKNENWYVYNDNYGTSEEKAFVKYFKNYVDSLKEKYENVYLIRNERLLKLFTFENGQRFEPDYILILDSKKQDKSIQYHIFIEPKGEQLIQKESEINKEKFLREIETYGSPLITIADDNNYKIKGFPFFNRKERMEEFSEALANLT